MDSDQAQEILKGLINDESLEDLGASEVFTITDANNFPYEDLKEAYENNDTMVVLGNFGGMISLRIIEIEDSAGSSKMIKQWYDVDDKLESLELVEEMLSICADSKSKGRTLFKPRSDIIHPLASFNNPEMYIQLQFNLIHSKSNQFELKCIEKLSHFSGHEYYYKCIGCNKGGMF